MKLIVISVLLSVFVANCLCGEVVPESTELEFIDDEATAEAIDIGENGMCSCRQNYCSCCVKLKIKKLKINNRLCIKMYLLRNHIGVKLEITFGGRTIYRKEISIAHPPSICLGIPGAKKFAKICVDLYNMGIAHRKVHGCIKLRAKLMRVTVFKMKLGCFSIPFLEDDDNLQSIPFNDLIEQIRNTPEFKAAINLLADKVNEDSKTLTFVSEDETIFDMEK